MVRANNRTTSGTHAAGGNALSSTTTAPFVERLTESKHNGLSFEDFIRLGVNQTPDLRFEARLVAQDSQLHHAALELATQVGGQLIAQDDLIPWDRRYDVSIEHLPGLSVRGTVGSNAGRSASVVLEVKSSSRGERGSKHDGNPKAFSVDAGVSLISGADIAWMVSELFPQASKSWGELISTSRTLHVPVLTESQFGDDMEATLARTFRRARKDRAALIDRVRSRTASPLERKAFERAVDDACIRALGCNFVLI